MPTPLILTGLVLGTIAGATMHRSDFCVAGMFRDLFLFRRAFMLRPLLLLVAASMVLFEIGRQTGLVPLYPFPLFGPPSLANLLGGIIFGVGMVLAGGCVVGTLYKLGAGSLTSGVAFVGLIAGSTIYGELHPWWSVFARATTLPAARITIPQKIDTDPLGIVAMAAVACSVPFFHWYRQGCWTRRSPAAGYLQPWQAALILALIGLISATTAAMPLGITTAYAKIGSLLESLLFPERIAYLAYFQGAPLSLSGSTTPVGQVPLLGGPGPRPDAISMVQFPVIGGIILGSALSALSIGEFRLHWRIPARQWLSALCGGIIMGLAARMAPACSIWHLFGGLPIFAWQSILFVIGLLPGTWLGCRLLTKFVM